MILPYIAAGGAIGASLRYLVTSRITGFMGINFPYGTIFVNIAGSLFMGLLIGYFAKTLSHSNELRAFLSIGVLGGFTTFSAFSLDAASLIERGNMYQAAIYVVSSVLISILALFAGLYITRQVL